MLEMAQCNNLTADFNNMRRNTSSFVHGISPLRFPDVDLRGLLELLNTTTDVNLLVKLFFALSTHLMFHKDANLDAIIKCSAVYDRIHTVLINGLPRKATFALNFLSALLYVDAQEESSAQKRALAMHAKNMARISGCLGVMTDLFTNCMMYHDTWKALCQCLALVCSGNEINQSYCTHLIPACIRKCSQTNMDIFILLQSLVLNHNPNMRLFLDCNGLTIFTRELLHYDKCLQLLTTVVQCSDAVPILRNTNVIIDLREFLRLYGPRSQIGQKAMIILNHIEPRSRGIDSHTTRNINKDKEPQREEFSKDFTRGKGEEGDDTKILMQNVMKEIFDYRQNELAHLKKDTPKAEVNNLIRAASATNLIFRNCQPRPQATLKKSTKPTNLPQNTSDTSVELSFSYLKHMFKDGLNNNYKRDTTKRSNELITGKNTENTKTLLLSNTEKNKSDFYESLAYVKPTPMDPPEFRPIFSSTPKHKRDNISKQIVRPIFSSTPKHKQAISKQINYSKTMSQTNMTIESHKTSYKTSKVQKRRSKMNERSNKPLRNRSLSSRFFGAINESCTTLVKTVANIFKKKESPNTSEDNLRSQSSSEKADRSCSYSFLKYMQKRDAVLNNGLLRKGQWNKGSSDFSVRTKSCDTCDDTEILKRKLSTDKHLKRTVKKLKLGINLYGCDFKKISRAMWPRESYMTPVVLYNLYRKLLNK